MQNSEIKLIQNKSEGYWRVTVNGKDEYMFPFLDELEAKAAAFDQCIKEIIIGNEITVSYLSY
jgi:hypothetical protein